MKLLHKAGVGLAVCLLLATANGALSAEKKGKGPVGPDGKPLPPAKIGDVKVVHAWTRAARRGETTHVFMTIENTGQGLLRLRGGEVASASAVRLVRFVVVGAHMRAALVDPVAIGPKDRFAFEPGVVALELWNLQEDLEKGSEIEVALEFSGLGKVTVVAEVDGRTAVRYDPPAEDEPEADEKAEKH